MRAEARIATSPNDTIPRYSRKAMNSLSQLATPEGMDAFCIPAMEKYDVNSDWLKFWTELRDKI